MFGENLYWMFPNALDAETCAKITKMGDDRVLTDARVGNRGAGGTVAPDIRDTKVAWLESQDILDVADTLVRKANYAAGWDLDILGSATAQYGVYEVGMHYKFHQDAMMIGSRHRKLSLCISLNDDYQGGAFVLKNLMGENVVLGDMRSTGTAVVFSSLLYHTVEPVTSGVRKSLVVWAMGPKTK